MATSQGANAAQRIDTLARHCSMVNIHFVEGKKNMKIAIAADYLLLFLIVMLSGCSYHGKLEPNSGSTAATMATQPYTLAIDASMLASSQVKAEPQWFELTVDSGDALAESLKQQLSRSFKSVTVLSKNEADSLYDYLVTVDSNTTSRCTMNSCGITTRISMQMVDAKQKDRVLLAEDFLDVYTWQMPGGSVLINLFSGLSLLILAPVLQPISAHFCGKEMMQRVSESNDRMSFQIAKKIVSSDIFGKKAP